MQIAHSSVTLTTIELKQHDFYFFKHIKLHRISILDLTKITNVRQYTSIVSWPRDKRQNAKME